MYTDETLNNIYTDDLIYSDTCWLTAHNAYTYNWKIYAQQNIDLSESFKYGTRSFMLDVHDYYGSLALCHDSCTTTIMLQKPGAPEKAQALFEEIHSLLKNNEKDIITLHFEAYVPSTNIYKVLDSSGLSSYLLKSKNPNDPSLSLGKMRKDDERLVVFSDYGAGHGAKRNFTNFNDPSNSMLPGIYYTIYYKEPEFNLANYFNCEMYKDFRADPADLSIKLFTFNHFYSISKLGWPHTTTNSYENMQKRLDICKTQGLSPNFLAVDFVQEGDNGGAKKVVFDLMKKKTVHTHEEL